MLPDFFETMLAERFDADDVARILDGCSKGRAVTLRANTLRSNRASVADALDKAGIGWSPVAWYDDAFVLADARERNVWDLPVYQEGHVYVQSLSSMIPALVLGARAGEDVCDMCAAPGGKTTQIAALAGGAAYVTACEMHAPRAEKLEHNLRKLGAGNVTVMRCDARRLDDFFSFDRILVDAPCSGSGTLQADDPKVERRFTTALIDKSVKAQRALLAKGLSLLKPGGTLVYSTCSVLPCENEEVVEWALDQVRRKGVFELKPVELAGADLGASPGVSSGSSDVDPGAAPGPRNVGPGTASGPSEAGSGATSDADTADLPLLPSALEGTLTLCPTALYEGFFIAKIVHVS